MTIWTRILALCLGVVLLIGSVPSLDQTLGSGRVHRWQGQVDQALGSVQQSVGHLTGNRSLETQGRLKQVQGKLKQVKGQAESALDQLQQQWQSPKPTQLWPRKA